MLRHGMAQAVQASKRQLVLVQVQVLVLVHKSLLIFHQVTKNTSCAQYRKFLSLHVFLFFYFYPTGGAAAVSLLRYSRCMLHAACGIEIFPETDLRH